MPELTTSATPANSGIPQHAGRLHLYWRLVFAIGSGLLMGLPFLEPGFYVLSWFGLVPLFFAVRGLSLRHCYALSLSFGFVLYLCGSYWILPFISNMKGYGLALSSLLSVLNWIYSAHAIVVVMLLWRWMSRDNLWQRLLLFPLLFVAVYSVFPSVFPVQLSASQSHVLLAVQAIDTLGVYGLDFVIALSNICLFELLRQRTSRQSLRPFYVFGLIFVLWFAYGKYSLSSWDQHQESWPIKKIGLVQPHDQPSIEIPEPKPGFGWSYPPEMQMTERLVQAGAEIVFWPESRYKGYFDNGYVRAAYLHRINQIGIPLVMQDLERVNSPSSDEGNAHTYNTMMLLSEQGELVSHYRKQQRIAFGEYMPWVEHSETLMNWAQVIVGDFLSNIAQGQERNVFSAAGMHLIPLICYEVLFPEFVADAASQAPHGGVLVAASFDGWFGQSHAPLQHLAISRMRAIENRLPMVHVINNGPSAVVMPSGRILAQTEAFKQLAVNVEMPYSDALPASFYSAYPRFFLYSVYLMLLCMGIIMLRAKK